MVNILAAEGEFQRRKFSDVPPQIFVENSNVVRLNVLPGLGLKINAGRRKPIDTFASETLIRITGRSTYTDKSGRVWRPKDFILSALLGTHDWQNEPMVLVSLGKLKEQVGLEKTRRRFSIAQLAALP